MQRQYVVVYRTGGRERCKWHRTVPSPLKEAIARREDVERMGYKAIVEGYERSMAVGLPEGWGTD